MADDIVDVLIVGAGASGAAVAWSLAETRMRIVCLEQGGWMNPAEYPSTGRDWEMAPAREFRTSPNLRRRAADYPVNDSDSPIAILNFNAVGGSTILYSAHFPRFHPSDFRVRTLDGVADDWPIDYGTLEPYFAESLLKPRPIASPMRPSGTGGSGGSGGSWCGSAGSPACR